MGPGTLGTSHFAGPQAWVCGLVLLREEESNLRPLGYESNELPLLYPAITCLISL